MANKNYYSNSQLIGAGGDTSGTLDFYSVHYYSTIDPNDSTALRSIIRQVHGGWTSRSSLQNLPWKAERGTRPAFRRANLFDTLYQLGYAGALPWSWTDPTYSTTSDMIAGIHSIWDNYMADG